MKTRSPIQKLGYRPQDVVAAFGSEKLYFDCYKAGWLQPVVKRHKLLLFDWRNVEQCWERIKAGEKPV